MHRLFERIISEFFELYTRNQHLPTELLTNVITARGALAASNGEWISIMTNYEQGAAKRIHDTKLADEHNHGAGRMQLRQ